MKKTMVIMFFALALLLPHSALATKHNDQVTQLIRDNIGLLQQLTECQIEKLEMQQILVDFHLSTINVLLKNSSPTDDTTKAMRTKTELEFQKETINREKAKLLDSLKEIKKL